MVYVQRALSWRVRSRERQSSHEVKQTARTGQTYGAAATLRSSGVLRRTSAPRRRSGRQGLSVAGCEERIITALAALAVVLAGLLPVGANAIDTLLLPVSIRHSATDLWKIHNYISYDSLC